MTIIFLALVITIVSAAATPNSSSIFHLRVDSLRADLNYHYIHPLQINNTLIAGISAYRPDGPFRLLNNNNNSILVYSVNNTNYTASLDINNIITFINSTKHTKASDKKDNKTINFDNFDNNTHFLACDLNTNNNTKILAMIQNETHNGKTKNNCIDITLYKIGYPSSKPPFTSSVKVSPVPLPSNSARSSPTAPTTTTTITPVS